MSIYFLSFKDERLERSKAKTYSDFGFYTSPTKCKCIRICYIIQKTPEIVSGQQPMNICVDEKHKKKIIGHLT